MPLPSHNERMRMMRREAYWKSLFNPELLPAGHKCVQCRLYRACVKRFGVEPESQACACYLPDKSL